MICWLFLSHSLIRSIYPTSNIITPLGLKVVGVPINSTNITQITF
jgi:hypothetical protein